MYTFGIDAASYQGVIDCAQLRADGHDFLIEKVTGEGAYVNPDWQANRDGARAAGLIFGGYDWTEPQGAQDGEAAAIDYLTTLGTLQTGELLTVDYETPDWHTGPLGRSIEPWMRAYMYTLRDKAQQPVFMYTGPYFMQETGAAEWAWLGQDFHLWEAAPGAGMMADDSFWPSAPTPFTETLIHQHQWHAYDRAVVGEFDRNRFRGTRAELMAYGKPGVLVAQQTPAEAITAALPPAVQSEAYSFKPFLTDKGEACITLNCGGTSVSIDNFSVILATLDTTNAAGEHFQARVEQNIFSWKKQR